MPPSTELRPPYHHHHHHHHAHALPLTTTRHHHHHLSRDRVYHSQGAEPANALPLVRALLLNPTPRYFKGCGGLVWVRLQSGPDSDIDTFVAQVLPLMTKPL